ncbi:MAG TPA: DUF302 domain-containing protein [Candidatus Dormibacteraeota bacterium]|nr:DUF302 domain-containing protein [Candidatus Dormibacteraeota bacterium]
MPSYGNQVKTTLPYSAAVERVKALLREEGFGVLCEIDVAATVREKLGETFRPYCILGACNPQLAHRAISAEPQIGLLLPCNVVVQELDGATSVSAVDAGAMLAIVGNPQLDGVASDVNARLKRVLDAISST